MNRIARVSALAPALALLAAGSAQAATLRVSPSLVGGSTSATVHVSTRARASLALRAPGGRIVTWLGRADRGASTLEVAPTLDGRPLADGRYRLELWSRGRVVARSRLRVDNTAPAVSGLTVSSGQHWADDGPLEATVTPDGDGVGDTAQVTFTVDEPSWVALSLYDASPHGASVLQRLVTHCGPGPCTLSWDGGGLAPGAYPTLLRVLDRAGNMTQLGHLDYRPAVGATSPVLRVRRISAYADAPSVVQGGSLPVEIASDRSTLTLTVMHVGPETAPTVNDFTLNALVAGTPTTIAWTPDPLGYHPYALPTSPLWPSGVYVLRIQDDVGQTEFVPFVLTPLVPGTKRIAIVVPTNTWQAYNRADGDGDGIPDTWYVTPRRRTVPLLRPYDPWGLPMNFRLYDLPFLHWLEQRHPGSAEYLSDAELGTTDGATLASRYDLVVLEGHEEYVSDPMYTALTQYVQAGGNLLAMFANSLFWEVDGSGGPNTISRVQLWRQAGRPEAALLGAQYLANDNGTHRLPMTVMQAVGDPGRFAFAGTGLRRGAPFGSFGIEIDHTAPSSPPGTIVLAQADGIFGPRYTAQMTMYTTPAGAKVVDAGAYLFAHSAVSDRLQYGPAAAVLENLWHWLRVP